MPTSYPGIYISEDASLNLSVAQTPSAVPAFICQDPAIAAEITCFNSWAEIEELKKDHALIDKTWSESLRIWFSLSGGKCYVVKETALAKIAAYDDITLIVANGQKMAILTAQLETLCAPGQGRFMLLDGPKEPISSNSLSTMAPYPNSAFAAVWYPWLKTVNAATADALIPPSVIAAVAIALTDRSRGVWKAPANVVINGLTPAFMVSDDLQGKYNQNNAKALNMIRDFPGSGTTVWGGRTLDTNENWRYISVRRLFNSIEKDIARTLRAVVFEPNSQPTWQKVKAAIDNYLYGLWQQGALAGEKPADAWFVQLGKDITMSAEDIRQGNMIVNIGVAAVRPAEFIVINLSQTIAQQ